MKKIITAVIFLLIAFTAFPQEDTGGFDMDVLLEALGDDEAMKDYDLSQFQGEIGAEEQAIIRASLEEDGLDEETINATMEAVGGINDGTYSSLGDIEDSNPELYSSLEDAILSAVAETISSSFIGDDNTELVAGLQMIDSIFSILGNTAQATAYTSTSTSLFGYKGYKYFALSLGFSGALAADVSQVINFYNEFNVEDDIMEKLSASGISAGVSAQAFSATIGLNTDWLIDRTSVEIVLGLVDVGIAIQPMGEKTNLSLALNSINLFNGDVSALLEPDSPPLNINLNGKTEVYGLKVNYQIIKPLNVPFLFRWNGLSAGAGFIYTGNNMNAVLDLGSILELQPGLLMGEFNIDSYAATIPLEVSTGIRLLSIINLSAGAGIDIQFGESTTGFGLLQNQSGVGSKLITKVLDNVFAENDMSFPYRNTSTAGIFNPRVALGLGLGIGPVTFDLSGVLYINTGFVFTSSFVLRF